MRRKPNFELTRKLKDEMLQWVCALRGYVEFRRDAGWSNSSPEQLMWWLGAGRKRLVAAEKDLNRGRYVTAPWWCLPEQRTKCARAKKCLKGNCAGTRKEKFRKCRRIRLFQTWGFCE